MYKLYPNVKAITVYNKEFSLKDEYIIFFQSESVNVFRKLNSFLKFEKGEMNSADILYLEDSSLNKEAYKLEVQEDKIIINFNSISGAYYATLTLYQIFTQVTSEIRTLKIFDEPDLAVRGLMLDISRDKVPTVSTIKKVIDLIASLKMNHLELYVEGFSYGYPSFQEYLEKDGYISVEEFQEIEAYANMQCIDLVPNQNGFGHMTKWLEKEELNDLSEVPGGIFLWGRQRKASTLNPLDPKSLELVKKLYQDMLPFANSKYFNMNFDEPFELGKGKSKAACDEQGIGNVYIDYVLKVYEEIKKYDKIPMIWGDVLIKHPELLHRLPKDMIFLDWGYDANYPFNANLKKLSELGIKFIAAPGTTSWCSFAGRTNDWWENIANACIYTKMYQGEGVIVTDWGDFGHLQYLPISIAPIVFTAMMTWRVKEGTFLTLDEYLNRYVFKDEDNFIAEILLDLGNYYRYLNEYRGNGSATFYNFMWATYAPGEANPCEYYRERTKTLVLSKDKYELLHKFLNQKIEEIQVTKLHCVDAQIIKDELYQTISLLKAIHKLNVSYNEDIELLERIKYLEEVVSIKERLLSEHRRLWLSRNKVGGLASSLSYLEKFVQFAEISLKELLKRGEENED